MNGRDPVPHVARIIIEELLDDPRASALVELAQNANDFFAAFRARQSPPPVDVERAAPEPAGPSPRERLLFGQRDVLTKELIRKRRASLAALCHPDAGGDADVMAALNAAADELLAECERREHGGRGGR